MVVSIANRIEMEPTEEQDICKVCNLPRKRASRGSLTQWIFEEGCCRCGMKDAPPQESSGPSGEDFCFDCGKRKGGGRAGSFTQWIFRQDLCNCVALTKRLEPIADRKSDESSIIDFRADDEITDVEPAGPSPKVRQTPNMPIAVAAVVLGSLLIIFGSLVYFEHTHTTPSETPGPKVSDPLVRRTGAVSTLDTVDSIVDVVDMTKKNQEKIRGLHDHTLYRYDDTELEINGKDATDEFAKKLVLDKKVCNLIVQRGDLTDGGLGYLCDLGKFEYLSLFRLPKLTDRAVDIVAEKQPKLKRFALSFLKMSPRAVEKVKRLSKLDRLVLVGMQLDAQALNAVVGLTNLRNLTLESCGLEDDAIDVLLKMDHLVILDITANSVTDKGIIKLAKLKRLRLLKLARCGQLTVKGIRAFESAAPNCTVADAVPYPETTDYHTYYIDDDVRELAEKSNVKEMDLSGWKVTDNALTYLAGKNVQLLDISRTAITDRGLLTVSQMETLDNLRLGGMEYVSDEGLKHIGKLHGLKILKVDNKHFSEDAIDDLIVQLPKLMKFDASNRRVTKKTIEKLATRKELLTLVLSDSDLTDDTVVAISKLPYLINLRINMNSKLTDKSLVALGSMKNLQALAIVGCPSMTDAGINQLRSKLSHCQVIH